MSDVEVAPLRNTDGGCCRWPNGAKIRDDQTGMTKDVGNGRVLQWDGNLQGRADKSARLSWTQGWLSVITVAHPLDEGRDRIWVDKVHIRRALEAKSVCVMTVENPLAGEPWAVDGQSTIQRVS